MAAISRATELSEPQPSGAIAAPQSRSDIKSPIARLAALHVEAEETARLANLLGRSIYASAGIAAATAIIIAISGADPAKSIVWGLLVAVAAAAIALRYARTIREPFQRPALQAFEKDLGAILLYAGFAWGAGAFLVLPASTGFAAIVLFAAGASAALAMALRERDAVFLFLAPTAVLTSFASVLRPLPGGALDAALVLIACAGIAAAMLLAERFKAQSLPQLADLQLS